MPNFTRIHGYLWDSLFKQMCGIVSIKATFDLIDTITEILQYPSDEPERVILLDLTSERAYRALLQHEFHQGSVMYLTEICIALRKQPRTEIMTIFENVTDNPNTKTCKYFLFHITLFYLAVVLLGTLVP